VTVLSQVTEASLGDGFGYYVVQFATVVLLALAANTSFGGLPVLAQATRLGSVSTKGFSRIRRW
jgi:hypothetical protein